ncbi:MAG: Coenzyme F420 hydrogenase/dehydrogenase, beta subunit C-terminal domain [Verrucomicrobia bacterium]|nr:Coenzyme F420 hydrogenase/dehydrogenase, beta subunit C-terminal domain [Verrucomicrobiota bacterium]
MPAPEVLAAWHLDSEVRRQSSSGGVFTALAEEVLSKKGLVFGAVFDQDFVLVHRAATTKDELGRTRGSKYLQSRMGDAYCQAKTALKSKAWVLFVGTPCQIAGLKNYLDKEYETLVTCDLVCHGVPSPKVFQSYLAELAAQRHHPKTETVSFRNKRLGWKKFSMSVAFVNGERHEQALTEDPFLIGFLRDLYLRPSCHACQFSCIPRVADITLGDFWGIGGSRPELDDDRGTSLLLINSTRGKAFFELCRKKLFSSPCSLAAAIASNSCLIQPVAAAKDRDRFFETMREQGFAAAQKKFTPSPTLFRRMRSLLRTYAATIVRKARRFVRNQGLNHSD